MGGGKARTIVCVQALLFSAPLSFRDLHALASTAKTKITPVLLTNKMYRIVQVLTCFRLIIRNGTFPYFIGLISLDKQKSVRTNSRSLIYSAQCLPLFNRDVQPQLTLLTLPVDAAALLALYSILSFKTTISNSVIPTKSG